MTGDIYTCASDGEEMSDQPSQIVNSIAEQQSRKMQENSNRIEPKTLNLESRLPGQVSHLSAYSMQMLSFDIDHVYFYLLQIAMQVSESLSL